MVGHSLGRKFMNPDGGCAKDYIKNLAGFTINKPKQQREKSVDGISPPFQPDVCLRCKQFLQLLVLVEVLAAAYSE